MFLEGGNECLLEGAWKLIPSHRTTVFKSTISEPALYLGGLKLPLTLPLVQLGEFSATFTGDLSNNTLYNIT